MKTFIVYVLFLNETILDYSNNDFNIFDDIDSGEEAMKLIL
jgi:hypothetical protein